MAIPPPNVTGVLHMGHALNNSMQDCLARYHRMRGQRTKWILGTDHAGIATQTQVERALAAEGSSREELGREPFVERVWEWRGSTAARSSSSSSASAPRRTMPRSGSPSTRPTPQAVLRVFVALHEKGYIYRDRYMVNWDPGSGSAISDLEVEPREVTDTLYYIDYPLASGSGAITVATVRPETMLADTAIAVHPEDERYRRLIGEKAVLPLVGRKLKIIADEYVQAGVRHRGAEDHARARPQRLRDRTPPRTRRSSGDRRGRADQRRGARALPRADHRRGPAGRRRRARASRACSPAPSSYTHTVPFSHRSGERIEPLISLQWFMRMDELAKPAIAAVTSGRVRFHPTTTRKVYLDWMENIRPWCISRQLWWGHRLPVWYRGDETYVGTTAPAARAGARSRRARHVVLQRAVAVRDARLAAETPELQAFYPTDALVTGRDIIFLWVARMIMMGLEFTGTSRSLTSTSRRSSRRRTAGGCPSR